MRMRIIRAVVIDSILLDCVYFRHMNSTSKKKYTDLAYTNNNNLYSKKVKKSGETL